MEATMMGYIRIIGLYWGYIGIMEKKRLSIQAHVRLQTELETASGPFFVLKL